MTVKMRDIAKDLGVSVITVSKDCAIILRSDLTRGSVCWRG